MVHKVSLLTTAVQLLEISHLGDNNNDNNCDHILMAIMFAADSFNLDTQYPIHLSDQQGGRHVSKLFGYSLDLSVQVRSWPAVSTWEYGDLLQSDNNVNILIGDPLNINSRDILLRSIQSNFFGLERKNRL